MAFNLGFYLNLLPKPQAPLFPPVSSNPFAVSHGSVVSTSLAKNTCHPKKNLKLPRGRTRASAEGPPNELTEDSKFVPLNPDDPTYGPTVSSDKWCKFFQLESVVELITENNPGIKSTKKVAVVALLLLGFQVDEAEKIRQFLKEMDGEFLEIIFCTEDMITCSLWDAVNMKQPNLEELKIAKSLPRICFFSGLSGEEMMMFIDAFPETGLEPAIFAALVPNSADKPVAELIEEIVGDHEMLLLNGQAQHNHLWFNLTVAKCKEG